MKDGERVVMRLSECGKIMADGEFSFYDLNYIKQALEMMLNATNKTIEKNNKKSQIDANCICESIGNMGGAPKNYHLCPVHGAHD